MIAIDSVNEYRRRRQERVDGKRLDKEWREWREWNESVLAEKEAQEELINSIERDAETIKLFSDGNGEDGQKILERCIESIQKSVLALTAKYSIAHEDSAFFAGELDENIGERDIQYPEVEDFKERRKARLDARMDDEWKTIKGTHVLIDDEGTITKGPENLRNLSKSGGKQGSEAPATKPKVARGKEFEEAFGWYKIAQAEKKSAENDLLYVTQKDLDSLAKTIELRKEYIQTAESDLEEAANGKTEEQVRKESDKLKKKIGDMYSEHDSLASKLKEMRRGDYSEEEYDAILKKKINLKNKIQDAESKLYDNRALLDSMSALSREKKWLESDKERLDGMRKKREKAEQKLAQAQSELEKRINDCREYAEIDWDECETADDVEIKAAVLAQDGDAGCAVVRNIAGSLNDAGVKYDRPEKRSGTISEEQIIGEIGGGDRTCGSCASVALAYVANKAGYDVKDYRGGMSQEIWSRSIGNAIYACGAKSDDNLDEVSGGFGLLGTMEEGKEYYFTAGKHAAITRKNNGNLEYLELQSEDNNGWKTLGPPTLRQRFGCVNKTKVADELFKFTLGASIVEIGDIAKNDSVMSLLGFINTAGDKQEKGVGGHER